MQVHLGIERPQCLWSQRELQPQNMFRKSMKTKCHRMLHNLGALVSKCYRKISHPFSRCTQDYMFFEDVLSESVVSGSAESHVDTRMDKKRLPREEDISAYSGSFVKFLKESPLKIVKKEDSSPGKALKRVNAQSQNAWHGEDTHLKGSHCAGLQLERKMRELEMMEGEDLEHVLDIEEVIHYYSRLNTPAYIDIVDKFFTHICSDIYSPQSSPSQ